MVDDFVFASKSEYREYVEHTKPLVEESGWDDGISIGYLWKSKDFIIFEIKNEDIDLLCGILNFEALHKVFHKHFGLTYSFKFDMMFCPYNGTIYWRCLHHYLPCEKNNPSLCVCKEEFREIMSLPFMKKFKETLAELDKAKFEALNEEEKKIIMTEMEDDRRKSSNE